MGLFSKKPKQVIKRKKSEGYLAIGSKIYALSKESVDKGYNHTLLKVCKVKTYQNTDGQVIPVVTQVGYPKQELNLRLHYLYTDLQEALKVLSNIKPVNEQR